MAVTAIADIINPEVLADQVSAKFPDMLVLGQSGLVDVDGEFPLGVPGSVFKMPFWKRVAAFGALTEGTAMTPGKITTGSEYAVVSRAGAAYEVYDTASLVSKADPVAEISDQVARRAAEYIDNSLVLECDKTPNLSDTSLVSTGLIDQNSIITALTTTIGDNYTKMLAGGAVFMHSKVYKDLVTTGAIQNQYQSGSGVMLTGVLPTISGLPIFITDLGTQTTVSSALHYSTYVVGAGALALFYQRQVMVEFDRDILLQADIIAATVHFASHLYGYDDQGSSVVAEQNKSVHVVKLITK